MAVVEGERGPSAGAAIGRGLLIDVVPRVAIVMEAVIVIKLGRLDIGVVRVRMVVGCRSVVAAEIDRQRERGAVAAVSVVGAMTRQVAHRSDDPAEHDRGELDDGGLAARGHARGDVTPDGGRCRTPERRLYEMRHAAAPPPAAAGPAEALRRPRPESRVAGMEGSMGERVSLAIEKELLRRRRPLKRRKLGNRSEAMRDLMRRRLVEDEVSEKGEVVATLTLVYDHGQRELMDRLVEAGHHHHARVLSTLHVHLDDRLCLEVQALRGTHAELRHLADHVLGLKGVKHGQLVVSSARLWRATGRPAQGRAHRRGARHGASGRHPAPLPRGR